MNARDLLRIALFCCASAGLAPAARAESDADFARIHAIESEIRDLKAYGDRYLAELRAAHEIHDQLLDILTGASVKTAGPDFVEHVRANVRLVFGTRFINGWRLEKAGAILPLISAAEKTKGFPYVRGELHALTGDIEWDAGAAEKEQRAKAVDKVVAIYRIILGKLQDFSRSAAEHIPSEKIGKLEAELATLTAERGAAQTDASGRISLLGEETGGESQGDATLAPQEPGTSTAEEPTEETPGAQTHTVQRGDTLGAIAVRIAREARARGQTPPPIWGPGGLVEELARNGEPEITDPNVIREGQRIHIPPDLIAPPPARKPLDTVSI